MTDIYEQHRKAFPLVAAYVVMHRAERVATIAIKYPNDGAARLWAYVHWLGLPMVRGAASGFGYDKRSAALSSAAIYLPKAEEFEAEHARYGGKVDLFAAFKAAIAKDDGMDWERRLRDAGFQVFQAV